MNPCTDPARDVATSGLRESRYNVVVERDDRVWVYNGLSGQAMSLSADEWSATRDFLAGCENFPAVELLRDLTLGRMIVKDDLDTFNQQIAKKKLAPVVPKKQ